MSDIEFAQTVQDEGRFSLEYELEKAEYLREDFSEAQMAEYEEFINGR